MKGSTFSLITLALAACISCNEGDRQKTTAATTDSIAARQKHIDDLLASYDGFIKETGQTANSGWFCPDNVTGYPPVDVKDWNKVPVVTGRLPTYEEVMNGTSLIYYDKNKTPDARAYEITLPKLACVSVPGAEKTKNVIVIQVVQTDKDTVVGYRFLSGGNGSAHYRDVHFLSDAETAKLMAAE